MSDDFDLIDRIYEAGAMQETWPAILKSLSDRYGGAGGLLFAFGAQGAQNWLSSPDIQATLEKFLRDGWQEINKRPQRLAEMNYFGFVNDLDTFTFEEIEQDRVYKEFYSQHGLGWAAGTMIPVPSGDTLVFSFERAFKKGPFEDFELLELDAIRPHLARAALWSSRLDFKKALAMAEALEAAGLPAAVLRRGGRLYAANALFEKLMPAVVRDGRERLMLTNQAADAILQETLERLGVNRTHGQSRSIALPGTESELPMVVHISPIRGAANDVFSQSIALAMITPVNKGVVPNAEILQGLFDLTPAEARVARGIAEGKTIEALALASAVSRETIRTQLGAVLAKTGLNRQAELAALLSGSALREPGR